MQGNLLIMVQVMTVMTASRFKDSGTETLRKARGIVPDNGEEGMISYSDFVTPYRMGFLKG